MHFHAEHQFSSPSDAVLEAMVDPELYLGLTLPDLGPPEVLGRQHTAGRTRLELRYVFLGRLDPIARRLVGHQQLRWQQDVEVDPKTSTGRITFASDDPAHRLHGEGDITFASEGDRSTRRIDGVLVVAVPFVAALAERNIVTGLLRRLDLEAAAINERLGAG